MPMMGWFAGLPDLDGLRELLQRIRELLVAGGITLALAFSGFFLATWLLSHLRRPVQTQSATPGLASTGALWLSYIPVALTVVAALAGFVPSLRPFLLKSFALAVLSAAAVWAIAVGVVAAGGNRQTLGRARRALLQAGTPWYCLAAYLTTLL